MNNLCKTVKNLQINSKTCYRISKLLYSSSTGDEKIVIPNRIHRTPTDILHALSNTVGTDPTAPHYKFHDDPFLIPNSNIGKRTFAMAQESGRKAARWVRQENSELFQHKVADPQIEAFVPAMIYTEESKVEETDLKKLIENVEVSDAILVYNLLSKNGIPVSDELKQSLLELVCYYNHEDTLADDLIEERWFKQGVRGKERQRKTWKDGELAEQIFAEIENKEAKHYCVMIRGMAKYFQVDKAWALYQEALEKGLQLDTNTFNSILQIASFLKEGSEMRWELVLNVLDEMKHQKLKPNLGTLNSVLETNSTIGGYKQTRNNVLKTLAEFKNLGIEPSLATFYFILITFCRERGPVSHVLIDIMNQIEGRDFKIRDFKDTFFFVTAMEKCRNHLHDKDLAKRLDKLLHLNENYNLIGDSYKESIYYRHFFTLLCSTEPLEVFMETYNALVPNVYNPEPVVMEEIFKSINVNGAIEYIPQMWSHIVMFDHTNRENLLSAILKIMIENPPKPEMENHEGLEEKFTNIAWDIWIKIEEHQTIRQRSHQINWSGVILGDILTLCSRAKDFEKATTIFEKLNKDQHTILGEPSVNALEDYVQLCIDEKKPSYAVACLQYCVESGFHEGREIGKHIHKSMTLDEELLRKVSSLIGAEALKAAEKSKDMEKEVE